jgi:hypothetical protein
VYDQKIDLFRHKTYKRKFETGTIQGTRIFAKKPTKYKHFQSKNEVFYTEKYNT